MSARLLNLTCGICNPAIFLAPLLLGISLAVAAPDPDSPASPQQFYNNGTQKFREGKLREAEAALQMAVISQNEKVQVPALYNLGHVRFREGVEELKSGNDAKGSAASAKNACADGDEAIQSVDLALAGWDVQAMVAAYMEGRGARKELKAATEAVKRALESYGAVLGKWQRASGDFKSAHELNLADTDAQANAEVVDRSIAKLVDSQRIMMQNSECTKKNPREIRPENGRAEKAPPQRTAPTM